ncbi:unnamed protein product, partial [Didymodactylos carnosus]
LISAIPRVKYRQARVEQQTPWMQPCCAIAEQKIPSSTIVQQPKMEQPDNFPKGLSGGACFDW